MPAHCESNIFIQDTERIPVFVRNDVSTSHVETITRTTRIVNRRHCTLAFDRVAIRVVCTHNYEMRLLHIVSQEWIESHCKRRTISLLEEDSK